MKSGKVITQKVFSVEDCNANPSNIYVFGDNIMGYGKGGQAVIRGCDNAFGIPTKISPSLKPEAFFSDRDYPWAMPIILLRVSELIRLLQEGYDIVLPEDGLGTGLANLPKKAPLIYQALEQLIAGLKAKATIMGAQDETKDNPSLR